ncbi:bacteriohemerythrin [Desulfurispira natronophila]|uniref:Hemerythrin-like metal-binding protein n=1 Tax=Desulfurispira natronophila TaxID=682562 RepID=A0A7W8DGQ0_9BACT|nr:bacteriohemerythrin [Desulfurispira natronophila]MBB5021660.1 hemerythrin-like metal-binding protein [Desulfurispira natronophila]
MSIIGNLHNIVRQHRTMSAALLAFCFFLLLLILLGGRVFYEQQRESAKSEALESLMKHRVSTAMLLDRLWLDADLLRFHTVDPAGPAAMDTGASLYRDTLTTGVERLINSSVFNAAVLLNSQGQSIFTIGSPLVVDELINWNEQISSSEPSHAMDCRVVSDDSWMFLGKPLLDKLERISLRLLLASSADSLWQSLPDNAAIYSHHRPCATFTMPPNNLPDNFPQAEPTVHKIDDTRFVVTAPIDSNAGEFSLVRWHNYSGQKSAVIGATALVTFVLLVMGAFFIILVTLKSRQLYNILRMKKATVFSLANLAEWRDPETGDHLERTRNYGVLLARQLQRNPKFCKQITERFICDIGDASSLHDIGKVGIPDSILLKPGRLSDDEMAIMRTHTVIGNSVIQWIVDQCGIADSYLLVGRNISHYHHEKFNGQGYPEQLSGESIPLEARIYALCDVYDALRSRRPYKEPMNHDTARSIIVKERGEHFDPDVVDAFLELEDEFQEIHETYGLVEKSYKQVFAGLSDKYLTVEWSEEIRVGVPEIDRQHQELILRINHLFRAVLDGEGKQRILQTMEFLKEYIHTHFSTEESYMLHHRYQGYPGHKAQHDRFRQDILNLEEQLKNYGVSSSLVIEINRRVVQWLVDHIAVTDRAMADFLNRKHPKDQEQHGDQ